MISRQEVDEAVQQRQAAREAQMRATNLRLAEQIADHVLASTPQSTSIHALLVIAASFGLAADPELALDE